MIELVSLHMVNFRAFADASFFPAPGEEGTTALSGDNGSGKSTIVTALLWCLYGTTPDGVSVKGLRKQNTTEPTIVTATLNHAGNVITVERSLRGTNDKTMARITVDGKKQTETSARTATQWFINRTGLSVESFTSAFVIQQKELDSLVRARPAERRRIIERLAGIERMSKAIAVAKDTAKTARIARDSIPLPTRTLEELTTECDTFTAELNNLTSTLTELRATLTQRNDDRTRFAHLIAATRGTLSDIDHLEREKETLEKQLSAARDEYHHNANIIAKHSDHGDVSLSIDVWEAEIETCSQELYDLETSHAEHQKNLTTLTTLEQQHATATTALNEIATKITSHSQELLTLQHDMGELPPITRIRTDLTTAREQDTYARERIAVLRNDISTHEEALTFLTAHHTTQNDSTCPTCLNPISNIDEVTQRFAQLITNATHTLNQHLTDTQKYHTRITQLSAEEEQWRNLETRERHLATEKEALENEHVRNQLALDTLTQRIHTLTALTAQWNDAHPNIDVRISELKTRIATLTAHAHNIDAVINATTRNTTLTRTIADATQTIADIDTRLTSNRATEPRKVLTETLTLLENTESDIRNLTSRITTAEHNTAVCRTNLATAERDVEHHRTATELWNTRNRDYEIASSTTESLTAFRKDRLARLTPELSDVTSDLLSTMTQGTYTLVDFDDDFTPYVTNHHGEIRPVSWLSGGEESLVALALRIGVGEVLAGSNNGNLLILDEVLTAQDRDRRVSTMAAIRTLSRQTILINHIEEATDIADTTIHVHPAPADNPEEGSSLHPS